MPSQLRAGIRNLENRLLGLQVSNLVKRQLSRVSNQMKETWHQYFRRKGRAKSKTLKSAFRPSNSKAPMTGHQYGRRSHLPIQQMLVVANSTEMPRHHNSSQDLHSDSVVRLVVVVVVVVMVGELISKELDRGLRYPCHLFSKRRNHSWKKHPLQCNRAAKLASKRRSQQMSLSTSIKNT